MKRRLIKLFAYFALSLGIGLLYAYVFMRFGIGIPCLFRMITGLKCPSCGVTHMACSLLSGDVGGAYQDNRLMFVLLPVFCIYAVKFSFLYVKNGHISLSGFDRVVAVVLIVILILFGIIRNIYLL